ncbi:metal ABC transporter ATP-binding protein [Methylobacterium nodulans]|uniref:ABC transporter related n=1 Tax=Methylobacterium nodulans (strain LMG 21967 / CNCM I-2342 / ORS 2060) TaxID=460265 RepID=B8IPA8_METNO|nr:ABC transporter ATP-binding protein [Methylobacterium nodulans]ACL60426.1 ABC transporter related [Methylobacterium nodulans ORS 2060]
MTAPLAAGAVAFRGLTLGYDRHPAVHHLDGVLPAGGSLAVVGPNGAGKSTLLKGIIGEVAPLDGRIEHPGLERRDFAYLPQAAEIDRSFPIGVHDFVAMGLWRRIGAFGALRPHRRAVAEALATVGLTGFERRPIGTLSGGQLRRAMFARVMLQDARAVLLDEPFAAVDSRTTADLLDLVHRWRAERRTVIAVLHDFDQVRRHFPTTLLLAREAVAWGDTEAVLTAANLRRARQLCEAWDDTAPVCRGPAVHAHEAHAHEVHAHEHAHRHDGAHSHGGAAQDREHAA